MASPVEEAFLRSHPEDYAKCPQCDPAVQRIGYLCDKYTELNNHLLDVLAGGLQLEFADGAGAQFDSHDNVITLPHTKRDDAADVDDIVDGLIFESFNAIRRDRYTLAKEETSFIASGWSVASLEAQAMNDYYNLARKLAAEDRTRNMQRCIATAADVSGSFQLYCLSSPHSKEPNLAPEDERRLPSVHMYIYTKVVETGPFTLSGALLDICRVRYTTPTDRFGNRTVRVEGNGPKQDAARSLLELIQQRWPKTSKARSRPGALLDIIEAVQSEETYRALRSALTLAAVGFDDAAMQDVARANS